MPKHVPHAGKVHLASSRNSKRTMTIRREMQPDLATVGPQSTRLRERILIGVKEASASPGEAWIQGLGGSIVQIFGLFADAIMTLF